MGTRAPHSSVATLAFTVEHYVDGASDNQLLHGLLKRVIDIVESNEIQAACGDELIDTQEVIDRKKPYSRQEELATTLQNFIPELIHISKGGFQ